MHATHSAHWRQFYYLEGPVHAWLAQRLCPISASRTHRTFAQMLSMRGHGDDSDDHEGLLEHDS